MDCNQGLTRFIVRITLIAALCLITVTAQAVARPRPVACNGSTYLSPDGVARCSIDFHFAGTCDPASGKNELARWDNSGSAVTSSTGVAKTAIGPWEDNAISIVGLSVAFANQPQGFQYAFVGNSYNPDPMLLVSDRVTNYDFASSFWFQLPGRRAAKPLDYIDFHVGCATGTYTGFLTVRYIINK